MYIYQSHMGGLYTSDEMLDDEMLYCEECGDSDSFIGYAETREEARKLLKEEAVVAGEWDEDYIEEFLQNWIF